MVKRAKTIRFRKVYHVVCDGGVWKVKLEKHGTVRGGVCLTKALAISRAKVLGKNAMLGQVIVHKKNGMIQTEYTYGDDPKSSKG